MMRNDYPIRDAKDANERAYISVKNKKTGKAYRITGRGDVEGPSGVWKAHLEWLVFKGGLRYKGPGSGEPILIIARTISESLYWDVLEAVSPWYPPGMMF